MSISRHATYQFEDEENLKTVRLKKWSVTKFISLLRDLGDLLKLLGDDFRLDKSITPKQFAEILVTLGEAAAEKLTRIIKESIDDPRVESTQVLEWTLDDYIGILTKILELNLTEGLRKNFSGLKEKFAVARSLPKPN